MEKQLKSLAGQYCKVIIKKPDTTRNEVVTGVIDKISYTDDFVYMTTNQGPACFRLDTIIAAKKIKPLKLK